MLHLPQKIHANYQQHYVVILPTHVVILPAHVILLTIESLLLVICMNKGLQITNKCCHFTNSCCHLPTKESLLYIVLIANDGLVVCLVWFGCE